MPSTGQSKHTCSQCCRSFSTAKRLSRHIARIHSAQSACANETEEGSSQKEQLLCGLCEAKPVSATALWAHIKTHHLQLPTNTQYCPVCAQLITNADFNEHQAQQHPSVYCNFCAAVFPSFFPYRAHFNFTHCRVNSQVETAKVVCGVCEKAFPTGKYLMYHIYSRHLGLTRRTVCQYCGEIVVYKEEREHVRAKHSVTPCRKCGKQCKSQHLSQHMTREHS